MRRIGLAGGVGLLVGLAGGGCSGSGGAPVSATASATLSVGGPNALAISDGSFTSHSAGGDDFSLTQVNLTVTATGAFPSVSGTAQFRYDDLSGLLTFIPTGASGF